MKRNLKPALAWVLGLAVISLMVQPAFTQKKKIEKMDDLPRYTYKIDIPAAELYENDDVLKALAKEVKRDLENDLNTYEIEDANTLQGYYANLGSIAILEGDWEKYLHYLKLRKELETKEANKLTMGMIGEVVAKAKLAGPENYEENVRMNLRKKLDSLPYEVVQDNLKSSKGSAEIVSKNLTLGSIKERIQPMLDESGGKMSQDVARGLISTYFTLNYFIPIKGIVAEEIGKVIDANYVEKEDIWADRQVELPKGKDYHPVIMAVWDSGVDTDIYSKQGRMRVNKDEIPGNGKDDDGNGWVDDVYGVAWSLHSDYETSTLYPIGDLTKDEDLLRRQMKGLTDIQAAIDSPEAKELRAKLAQLKQTEVKPFIESIAIYGNYCHGTHVAGIASEGNPYARILVARMTFDHKMIPEEPTIAQAEKDATALVKTIDYFKANDVRVVNMSWGGSLRSIEAALEANNAGGTPEERKELARKIYEIGDIAFRKAIQGAPEILFVTSAGNSDNDVTFEEFYPSSYDYPNIISVGAVDQAGDETSFTSLGKVDVYGNGFEVMSYVPGGKKMKLNGTSMSSPQVMNLAGKLLAEKPDLTVKQLRQLIINGADKKDIGKREIALINPKKSMELLEKL